MKRKGKVKGKKASINKASLIHEDVLITTNKVLLKKDDIYVLDKHLVRLSPPPKNTRPGKLIKVSIIEESNINEKNAKNLA